MRQRGLERSPPSARRRSAWSCACRSFLAASPNDAPRSRRSTCVRSRHALRIEHAVEMVAFMLHHAGVEAARDALDRLARRDRSRDSGYGPAARPSRAGPGTDRQPSQPPSAVGSRISISGLISTVSGAVWSKRSASARPGSVRRRAPGTRRPASGTCTCGAARPAPLASIMVSTMSSTRRRISGRVGSATGLAALRQDRMAHAGDFQDGHGAKYGACGQPWPRVGI